LYIIIIFFVSTYPTATTEAAFSVGRGIDKTIIAVWLGYRKLRSWFSRSHNLQHRHDM